MAMSKAAFYDRLMKQITAFLGIFLFSSAVYAQKMNSETHEEQKQRIIEYFNEFNIEKIDTLSDFYHESIVFEDPLGRHEGLESLRSYYANLYKNVQEIRFEFGNIIGEGLEYSAPWTMYLKADALNSGEEIKLVGTSRIHFEPETNRVIYHRDYFDMGEFIYEHIPVVSSLIGFIKKRLQKS